MRICVPVEENKGLDSEICAHFGSAAGFLIVDLDTGDHHWVKNRNPHHSHGMCNPMASLDGEELDAVVVGGIGLGALRNLRAAGLEVFLADQQTVKDIVDADAAGALRRVTPALACGQHGRGPGGGRGGRGGKGCGGRGRGRGASGRGGRGGSQP
jgi:predicted Fe-Mo cluster-binding NifX family protein